MSFRVGFFPWAWRCFFSQALIPERSSAMRCSCVAMIDQPRGLDCCCGSGVVDRPRAVFGTAFNLLSWTAKDETRRDLALAWLDAICATSRMGRSGATPHHQSFDPSGVRNSDGLLL